MTHEMHIVLLEAINDLRAKDGLPTLISSAELSTLNERRVDVGLPPLMTPDEVRAQLGISPAIKPTRGEHRVGDEMWVQIKNVLSDVRKETEAAIALHGLYSSMHEAFGVLEEERDEFWDEVKMKQKDRDLGKMEKELRQIAAVAIKAILTLHAGKGRV